MLVNILTSILYNSNYYILVNSALLLSIDLNSVVNILSIDFSIEIRSDKLYFINLVNDFVENVSKYNSKSNIFSNG